MLEILTLVRQDAGREVTLEQTVNEYFGMDRYGDFKRIVADEVAEFLENFQNPDGTLTVPEVLRPYMNGRDVI